MDAVRRERFEAFATTRGPRLHRLAVLLTGDWHAAEDAVQSALAATYLAWSRVENAEDPDAYVRQVLVNTVRRGHRRRRVPEVSGFVPDTADVSGAGSLAAAEQRIVMLGALGRLPARQRAVIVLRHVLDLPESEVAALLHISVGTVKSQNAKGLARLRATPGLREVVEQ